jgi:soluble lytic murein transglycosylase-like protein
MSAPILRSGALQRALALQPVRQAPATSSGTFAQTLAQARTNGVVGPTTAPGMPKISSAAPAPIVPAATSAVQAGDPPYKDLIASSARKYGVPPALLAGLVKAESNFNPRAQSGVGAKGLGQLMDATARGLGVTDPFDPAQGLDGAAKFLGGLLKQFKGDQSLALAAYNAGPGAVQKYGGIPPYQETQRYVPKVLGFAAQYSRIWAN